MAVVIRLSRRGAKKKPFYRIVAADKRCPRDGKFIEVLGTFDPLMEEGGLKMNPEKTQSWLKNGAKPSQTVAALIKKAGITSEN